MHIHDVYVEALNFVTSRCIPAIINRLIKQRGLTSVGRGVVASGSQQSFSFPKFLADRTSSENFRFVVKYHCRQK